MVEIASDQPARDGPLLPASGVLAALVALGMAAAIGLLQPATSLAVLVAVGVGVVTWFRPHAGVAVLALSVPLQDAFPARIGSVEVTWTRLLTIVVVVAWLALVSTGRVKPRVGATTLAFLAMLLALAASVLNAVDIGLWGAEVYRWAIAALVFAIAGSVIRTPRDTVPVMAAFAVGAMASLFLALYQVFTSTGPESFQARGVLRAYGLFGEPNPFAGYLEIVTLLLLAAAGVAVRDGAGRRAGTWLFAAGGVAGVLALLLTQSRGGMLGFVAGCAVLLWVIWPRTGPKLVVIGATTMLVLLTTPPAAVIRTAFGLDAMTRDSVQVTPTNFAARERLAHWGAAVRMWQEYPWLGVGAGNFPERYREFTPEWRFRISRGHAHSAYLQAGAQAGVAGFLSYAVLLAAVAGGIVTAGRRWTPAWHALPAGGLAVTAAVVTHGMFEYLHVLSLGIVLSITWALATVEEPNRVAEPVTHGHG